MTRVRIKDNNYAVTLEERILRACSVLEDAGENCTHSCFYVSREGWMFFHRHSKNAHIELTVTGYRFVLPTWFGVVYVYADKSLFDGEDGDGSQTLEVEWGDSMTYEECIRQAELWMTRAQERKL